MLTYADALALLLKETHPLDTERVGLSVAMGRILAQPVSSPLSLPSFDNSAMDGYAIRRGEGDIPSGSLFKVEGMQAAGDDTTAYPGADACEIATGARLPDGFDTVIPVERCERDGEQVRIAQDEKRGQNIRRAGGDIRHGDAALPAGRRIDAAAVMLLAALGVETIAVARRPRVAIINTGSELHASGPLPEGGIHDSNGPYLEAALASWGVELLARSRVPDTGDAFGRAVDDARRAGADLIVTTGAVSAGRFDFVPTALAAMGASELFHKVAIRPGKPLLAARFDGGPLVLGLPGNPIAVAVGFRFFVAPVLRGMAGLPPESPRRVRLGEGYEVRPGLHHFALGCVGADIDGREVARAQRNQAAYRILPFTQANAWLTADDAFGDVVDAWPLDPAHAP
ncbi:molybdopterin molybdotransferase MoeA [Luteibacter aegosomatissinici]|uniref:molybdopterin molybdotransferase MoeA n=1 Tax=Luteibacter aegosomatissinici TaxID=2911539 RepID=UPI001FF9659A|nr:molybdopterin molybdotransferase MoeA [Luteibacter aegosomatissinici]UPG95149.1 molybdopterin molybdotransferase MoeA [Luteibacter aegosomatissinici]